jgi:hypothetical protein
MHTSQFHIIDRVVGTVVYTKSECMVTAAEGGRPRGLVSNSRPAISIFGHF